MLKIENGTVTLTGDDEEQYSDAHALVMFLLGADDPFVYRVFSDYQLEARVAYRLYYDKSKQG